MSTNGPSGGTGIPPSRFGAAKTGLSLSFSSRKPRAKPEAIQITRKLIEGGKMMAIPGHDHLIIAGSTYTSLAERGVFQSREQGRESGGGLGAVTGCAHSRLPRDSSEKVLLLLCGRERPPILSLAHFVKVHTHPSNQKAMTIEETRAIIEPYAKSHDPKYLTEDAVFIDTATGRRHEGRKAIGEMLDWIYHVAFDARADDPRMVIGEGRATLEATFTGKHTGEFAGIPATGKTVHVPLCVVYDVTRDGIKEGRIYMQAAVMMQQLKTTSTQPA